MKLTLLVLSCALGMLVMYSNAKADTTCSTTKKVCTIEQDIESNTYTDDDGDQVCTTAGCQATHLAGYTLDVDQKTMKYYPATAAGKAAATVDAKKLEAGNICVFLN